MAKLGLTYEKTTHNIGADFNKNPNKKCKELHSYPEEYSNKLVSRLQHWPLVSYFGLMSRNQQQQNKDYVSPEPMIGQSASLTRTRATRSQSISAESDRAFLSDVKDKLQEASTSLLEFLYSMWADKRLRWGLLFLLIIAPASKFIYLLFPEAGVGEYFIQSKYLTIPNFIETPGDSKGWYWQTLYYWFWMNGELWAPLMAIFGIFLLFPKNYFPSYLVGIPFGYFLSLLVHRMFVGTSEEYHNGVGTAMIAMFIILGVVIFIVSDKILFKNNHVMRAHEARIVGLINLPGLSWDQKEPLLRKEAEEWSKQQNELYDQKEEEKKRHQAQMQKVG